MLRVVFHSNPVVRHAVHIKGEINSQDARSHKQQKNATFATLKLGVYGIKRGEFPRGIRKQAMRK
jgi:hypothetical protein